MFGICRLAQWTNRFLNTSHKKKLTVLMTSNHIIILSILIFSYIFLIIFHFSTIILKTLQIVMKCLLTTLKLNIQIVVKKRKKKMQFSFDIKQTQSQPQSLANLTAFDSPRFYNIKSYVIRHQNAPHYKW